MITWGDPARGGDSSAVRAKLERDVEEVFASQYGELVIWGGTGTDYSGAGGRFGGDVKAVSEQLQSGVKEVFCNTRAFAAGAPHTTTLPSVFIAANELLSANTSRTSAAKSASISSGMLPSAFNTAKAESVLKSRKRGTTTADKVSP